MAESNTVSATSKTVNDAFAKKNNGKAKPKTEKEVKAAVKTALIAAKKAKVKLTKDQEEYCSTLNKEEQTYYREHGHLRGIVRTKAYKPERTFVSAAERKEAGKPPINGAQARILFTLSKARGPLTRQQITEITGVDNTYVGVWVGRIEKEKREASEKKWNYTSLITLGWARWMDVTTEGSTVMCAEITANGRKGLVAYDKYQTDNDKPTAEASLKAKVKERKAAAK